jgi:hypothetical protein
MTSSLHSCVASNTEHCRRQCLVLYTPDTSNTGIETFYTKDTLRGAPGLRVRRHATKPSDEAEAYSPVYKSIPNVQHEGR